MLGMGHCLPVARLNLADLCDVQSAASLSSSGLEQCNSSSYLCTRVSIKAGVLEQEIDDSVDRIVAGMEGTPMVDGKSKSLVAYHEVGHAVCATLTPGHDPVQKVEPSLNHRQQLSMHGNQSCVQ